MPQEPIVQAEPAIIGDLLPQELQQLTNLRQQSEQIVHQIGLNRVAEQRLMQQLQGAERQAQVVLNQTGDRLGIPDGTAWQVTGDGKAIFVGPPPAQVHQPAEAPAKAPILQVVPPPEG